MKLITGLEYRSKIRRKASCSPRHARATRSAELFIRDAANAPGCPSRVNSWASRFIMFRCVSEPGRTKVSGFWGRSEDLLSARQAVPCPTLLAFAVVKIVRRGDLGEGGAEFTPRQDEAQRARVCSLEVDWPPL